MEGLLSSAKGAAARHRSGKKLVSSLDSALDTLTVLRESIRRLKRYGRRQRERYLPDQQTRAYRRWIEARLRQRARHNFPPAEPGLFSVITAVWDGTPPDYFASLAQTLGQQSCEWVICDNGCRRAELVAQLTQLRAQTWVTVVGTGSNLGIAKGLRLCSETARGRYLVPVDADDDLYPDALALAADFIRSHNYPVLLYSDEDKLIGTQSSQPYFKPDFDPVLLSNSAYTAHLGFVDREKALALGAYTNTATEGSVDWDLFLRFLSAGYKAVHIPEVLYRWQIHYQSTADDSSAKSYIGNSQREALQDFLHRHGEGQKFSVVESPLLPGGAHFRLLRSSDVPPLPHAVLRRAHLREEIAKLVRNVRFVLVSEEAVSDEWIYEATGIFELFPDTVVVGGRVMSSSGLVLDADRHFGFGNCCSSPNVGRTEGDPGYFGQMFKQRSATTVSTRVIAIDREFLETLLKAGELSPYAIGAKALAEGRRIVYSPYISARAANDTGADAPMQVVPDRRYYPEPFSLKRGFRIE